MMMKKKMMMTTRVLRSGLLIVLALTSVVSCVRVPQNRRGKLADPMMSLTDDQLETYRKQKLYMTREGAAGGDGAAAGGGCGCH